MRRKQVDRRSWTHPLRRPTVRCTSHDQTLQQWTGREQTSQDVPLIDVEPISRASEGPMPIDKEMEGTKGPGSGGLA